MNETSSQILGAFIGASIGAALIGGTAGLATEFEFIPLAIGLGAGALFGGLGGWYLQPVIAAELGDDEEEGFVVY